MHHRYVPAFLLCSILGLTVAPALGSAQPMPATLRLSSFTTSSIEDTNLGFFDNEDETYALVYVLSPGFLQNIYRFGPHSLEVNQTVSLTGVVLQNCVPGQTCWGPLTADNPPTVVAALLEDDSDDYEHVRTSVLERMRPAAENAVSLSPQERGAYLAEAMREALGAMMGNISNDPTDAVMLGTPQPVTFSASDLEDAPFGGALPQILSFGGYRATFEIDTVLAGPSPYIANANISFHTNDEDKDEDTHVYVELKDDRGTVLARFSDYIGKLHDGEDSGPLNFQMYAASSAASARAGTVTIHIDPNGNDTWRFNFQLETAYSDGSITRRPITNLQLKEDARDVTFSIAPPPPPPPPPPPCQVDWECVQECVAEGCEPPARPSDCLRMCRRACCS